MQVGRPPHPSLHLDTGLKAGARGKASRGPEDVRGCTSGAFPAKVRGLRQLEIYFGALFNNVTSASGMPLSKVVKGAERRNIWW